jgi:60kDa lysophospholipase
MSNNNFLPPSFSPISTTSELSRRSSSHFTNSSVDHQHWSVRNTTREVLSNGTDSHVLILYAGGTMGMRYDPEHGYILNPGLLREILLSHPYFHDSKFSIEEYDNLIIGDSRISNPLVLPPSIYGKRIFYRILEYEELLDSSNMSMNDWVKIGVDISRYYNHFDGFVVIHGTDTLAYTSSALSFMLSGLGKPVILTGSQIPFFEARNDASDNLLGALTIAGHFLVPEVLVYFNHKLFRGNRIIKGSAVDLDAFESPNMKHLASMGVSINFEWDLIHSNLSIDDKEIDFRLLSHMEPNVAAIRFFPGITSEALRGFLSPPIKGVVLETFGTGNIPTNRPDLITVLREAIEKHSIVIVNVSQCRRGSVDPGMYATGRHLFALGVVPGYDMTVECALAKLSFLLGNFEDLERVKIMMGESLRGELTKRCHHNTQFRK